jgi:hypothetical protein
MPTSRISRTLRNQERFNRNAWRTANLTVGSAGRADLISSNPCLTDYGSINNHSNNAFRVRPCAGQTASPTCILTPPVSIPWLTGSFNRNKGHDFFPAMDISAIFPGFNYTLNSTSSWFLDSYCTFGMPCSPCPREGIKVTNQEEKETGENLQRWQGHRILQHCTGHPTNTQQNAKYWVRVGVSGISKYTINTTQRT